MSRLAIPSPSLDDETELSVSERTYQALLGRIVSRQIRAGEVLEERRLAAEFAVSRTPMRAALNRLLGEKILSRLSNGSIVVQQFGAAELLELLQIRRLLEGEAAAMAAGRIPAAMLESVRLRLLDVMQGDRPESADWTADNEVHDLVANFCGNKSLAGMIADARRRARMCAVELVPERSVLARQEHLAIVQALQSRDGEQARAAMVGHLDNVRSTFIKTLGYLDHGA
ncbi:GntR family transcriptional regulator [Orrella sp. JC864]|uniref:GntR family transcriptional regulator n=1 Tax=Orrella sp. JC864 TaxID=3120298 RepID=UPI0012BD7C17